MSDLETLWHDYHKRIYAYILRKVRDCDIVDDLVSCVFLRALVAMRNGNGSKTNAAAWLFAIARSVMADFWRSKQHVTFVDWDALEGEADADASPYTQAEATAIRGQLQRAMNQLEDSQKTSLRLRLGGLSNGEIAVAMGTTETAIRAVNTRAYHNLRNWLKDVA